MNKTLLLSLGGWILLAATGYAGNATRVVFILADDLGYGEPGCYGQKKIRTPNIDRLAGEGMRLTRHYSGAPTCAPSRCVLMTGKHLGNAEIRGNRQASVAFPEFTEGQHPLSAGSVTMASAFKAAGFTTGAMGKWGLGPNGSTGDPLRQGFDHFIGYNCQAVAHSFYPSHLWFDGRRVQINSRPIPGHAKAGPGEVRMEDWISETYAPDVMVREALAFIDRNQNRPFFLYLPFIEPHVAMHPPVDRVAEYPAEWDDTPYRGEAGYLPHPRPRAGYAAMISDLDRHVGAVYAALEKAGILEDTLIVFTSDNGTTHPGGGTSRFHIGGCDARFFNSTAGLRGYKGSLYEGGIRVPAIVRWPGKVPAGVTSDFPGYFADWFPTLAAAAGVKAPEGLDGINLLPVLTGAGERPARNPMVWVYAEYGGQVAVQIGDFKVLRQNTLRKTGPGPWQVYDVVRDPGETQDLAATRRDLVDQARAVLEKQWADNPVFPMDRPRTLAAEP